MKYLIMPLGGFTAGSGFYLLSNTNPAGVGVFAAGVAIVILGSVKCNI